MKYKLLIEIKKLSDQLKIKGGEMKTRKHLIPKFPNYHLCISTFKIININTGKALKPSKRKGSSEKFYKLYVNGVSTTLSLWQIILLIFDFRMT